MADTNIRFKIGSAFNGEGFKQAQKAIKENQKEIQASVRGLGSLSSAVAEISPKAEAAVGAVKGIASAFATGGIIGGAIQLAIQGISWAIGEIKDKMNEAAETTKKYAEILRDRLVAAFGDAKAKFEELRGEINRTNKEADDLLRVLNGEAAHEAQNKIFQIQQEKFQELVDAQTEEQKLLINATADYRIGQEKAALAVTEASNAIDANRKKVDGAMELQAAAHERAAKATEDFAALEERSKQYLDKRAQLENYLAIQEERRANGEITLEEILVTRKKTSLALQQLEEDNADTVKALTDAEAAKTAALKESADADYAVTQAQQALHQSVMKKDEALQEQIIKDQEGQAKVAEAEKRMQEAKEKALEQRLKADADYVEHQRKLGKALADETLSTEGLARLKKELTNNLKDGDSVATTGKGVRITNAKEIGANVSASINVEGLRGDIKKPRGLDDAVYSRIKNGTASVADFKLYDRMVAREERISGDKNRLRQDATRYLQLAQKPDSMLHKTDRDFMETFKNRVIPQLTENQAKELLGEAKGKLLTTMAMDRLLKSGAVIEAWRDKFAMK